MYYALAAVAALLFSGQFLFNQRFERLRGSDLNASLTFGIYSSAAALVLMLCLNRFRLEFSWFSLGLAVALALVDLAYLYCSIRAFTTANLSAYSNYAMLGGMLLPAITGILFYNEAFTVGKAASCALILAALLLTAERGTAAKGAVKYYLMVFVLNGMSGVLSKLHQSQTALCVSSNGFMELKSICTLALSVLAFLLLRQRFRPAKGKELAYSCGYAVLSAVGNLLVLIALTVLPASVQYPIITGGVIVFSALIHLASGTKPTPRLLLSVLLAFAATVAAAW